MSRREDQELIAELRAELIELLEAGINEATRPAPHVRGWFEIATWALPKVRRLVAHGAWEQYPKEPELYRKKQQ